MRIILVHNHYDSEKVESVAKEMLNLGTPKIRAVYVECWDAYVALEGCHRIRAAKAYNIVPEIVEIDYDAIKDVDMTDNDFGFDFDNLGDTFGDFIDSANKRLLIEF